MGSCGIQLGHLKRLRLLPCKMKGQIELCTKVCTIATELYQILTNFTQVHPGEELIERFSHWTLIIYIKLHQYAPISLYLKDSYDLWTVSYSILYRTSTWCPAVRKDNFSSPTAMPTVLKLRPSNRFPVLGVMLCSILLPMHTLRIMSSMSSFLPGNVNLFEEIKRFFLIQFFAKTHKIESKFGWILRWISTRVEVRRNPTRAASAPCCFNIN